MGPGTAGLPLLSVAKAVLTLLFLGEDVELENGNYGEFKVFVDDKEVVRGGALAFLGVLPSVDEVRNAVAAELPADKKPVVK